MTQGLKSCPFCGGHKARTIHIRDGRKVACLCGVCGKPCFHGPLDQPSAEDRAIAAWNARADGDYTAVAPDLLEALLALEAAQAATDEEVELCERAYAEGWDNDLTGSSHLMDARRRADAKWDKARKLQRAALAKAGVAS